MLLLTLALACNSQSGDVDTVGDSDPVEPSGSLALSAPPAFDPIARGGVSIGVTADAEADATVELVVLDTSGAEIWTEQRPAGNAEIHWDGRKEDGQRAPAGPYSLEARLVLDGGDVIAEAGQPLAIVRAGFVEAYAEDDGIISAREPLYFHRSASLQDVGEPFAAIASIDGPGETAAPFPPVSSDLGNRASSEPIAFAYDSRPILTLVPGNSEVLGGNGLENADVSLVLEGWTVLSGNPIRVGTPLVLMKDEPLADTVGVIETTLALELHTTGEDGTDWLLSTQPLPVRVYSLLGENGFTIGTDAKYHAWPAVVDPALRALDGIEPDHGEVVGALVEWIYYESGLEYDSIVGDQHYSTYREDTWTNLHFYLSSYLERSNGNFVNCSDLAAILSTHANMLGAPLNYITAQRNFRTNNIQAIGKDSFTTCPFGPTYFCGFSYHAVTTHDGGDTIWDATLALDGDDAPNQLPSTPMAVDAVAGDEYLDRLSPDSPWYQFETQATIQ
jgi:hypothetical protein